MYVYVHLYYTRFLTGRSLLVVVIGDFFFLDLLLQCLVLEE